MTSVISPVRSISDLARIAGVSVSTVSRALTGKGTLNQSTRDRIRAIADDHGFRLNVAAQNLRLGRTGAVGVLLPLGHERAQALSDPFFSEMFAHLANALTDHGYDLLVSRVLPQGPAWLDDFVRSGRTDGIILVGQSDQGTVLNHIAAHYRPMVVWGAYAPENLYTTVGSDNHAGGAMAAKHLLQRGCRRLAWFGHARAPEFAARQAGFLSSLPDDLRQACDLVPVHITPEGSRASAHAYFEAGHRPDGVFAASDIGAISVIAAAAEFGIRVPEDMAVIGFDDIVLARLSRPPLTTVRQDIEAGARMLVDLLRRRMAGVETQSVQFAPKLIVRESA
ncbi:LacI family DNA-binding transcriptional regulator [Novosphingobium acidiphilum]|uniref:LacI family DNA-binding transcriptional regulator n=1 Tax=Novosphingobium acidiphilum TaxID=505248 RepID=UPI0004009213|nr:LacI family DNA-binding transcriptional regulator [Novosphingobium acidiphilum]